MGELTTAGRQAAGAVCVAATPLLAGAAAGLWSPVAVVGAGAAAGPPVAVCAARRRARHRAEAVRFVWLRIADAVGGDAEVPALRVHHWRRGRPTDVTVTAPASFGGDWPAVAGVFAGAVGAPSAVVRVGRRLGRARLTVSDDAPDLVPVAAPVGVPSADVGGFEEALRPALAGVTVTGDADQLRVEYPAAVAAKASVARGEALRLARELFPPGEGREWTLAWDAPHRTFTLTAHDDPLRDVVQPALIGAVDPRVGVNLGTREDGSPWMVRLYGLHCVVGGMSGSGKGSVLWGIIRAHMPMIRDGSCVLYVVDPKGGMELGRLEPFARGFATDDQEALEVLHAAAKAMDEQARALRVDGVRALTAFTPERPFQLVIVDELMHLTRIAHQNRKEPLDKVMRHLLSKGRAPGLSVVAATQDVRVEMLPYRQLFTTAVALRLADSKQSAMLLGESARYAGADASDIPRSLPGVGFEVVDEGDPGRVRAAFVSDKEIDGFLGVPARKVEWRRVRPRDVTSGMRLRVDGGEVEVVAVEADGDRVSVDYHDERGVACVELDGGAVVEVTGP